MVNRYLSASAVCGVPVVVVREGLFDSMPELGGGGPAAAEVVAEIPEVLGGRPTGVVLDVRAAGEINHRTLAVVIALARELAGRVGRPVVCGPTGFPDLWQLTGGGSVCPASTTLAEAPALSSGLMSDVHTPRTRRRPAV